MSDTTLISLRMPNDLLAEVDRLALADRRSRAFVIVEKLRGVGHVGSAFGDGEERSVVGGSGVHASVGRGRAKKGMERVGTSVPDGEVDALPRPKTKDRPKAKSSDPVEVPVSGRLKQSTQGWSNFSRCPHDWVNSATCEKNDGGCVR